MLIVSKNNAIKKPVKESTAYLLNFAYHMMTWINFNREEQIDMIIKDSFFVPQLIFKHSTRCNISSMALSRLERQWNFEASSVVPFFLDLLTYRKISNALSDKFDIPHESPQLLLIRNGECVYDTSHNNISVENFREQIITE